MDKQARTVYGLRNRWYRYSPYRNMTKTTTANNCTYYLLFNQNGNLLEKAYDFVNNYRNDLFNLTREAIISAIKQLYEF